MGDIFLTEDVQSLLQDKYVQILGSSNWRSVYKDLICLAQDSKFIETHWCKKKGELRCQGDKLLEGGTLSGPELSNGIDYREKRLYEKDGLKISFEFITRVWNDHVQDIISKLKNDKPDILLLNSTLWDMSRYRGSAKDDNDNKFINEFKSGVSKLLEAVKENTDEDTLVIWCAEMPVGANPNGALFQNEASQFISAQLRYHVELANDFVHGLINQLGFDYIDFHFLMKPQMHRQVRDEIHWDNTGLRRVVNILLTHISEAYGEPLPGRHPFGLERFNRTAQDINQNQIESRSSVTQPIVTQDDGDTSPELKHRRLNSHENTASTSATATASAAEEAAANVPGNSSVLECSVKIDAIDDVNASKIEWEDVKDSNNGEDAVDNANGADNNATDANSAGRSTDATNGANPLNSGTSKTTANNKKKKSASPGAKLASSGAKASEPARRGSTSGRGAAGRGAQQRHTRSRSSSPALMNQQLHQQNQQQYQQQLQQRRSGGWPSQQFNSPVNDNQNPRFNNFGGHPDLRYNNQGSPGPWHNNHPQGPPRHDYFDNRGVSHQSYHPQAGYMGPPGPHPRGNPMATRGPPNMSHSPYQRFQNNQPNPYGPFWKD